jgi:hypothetical protein
MMARLTGARIWRNKNVDLVAALRAPELMERTALARTTAATLLARARRRLREDIDELFAKTPQVEGVLRAMLLGDRSFVERAESTDFQKTGVFHVLVEFPFASGNCWSLL